MIRHLLTPERRPRAGSPLYSRQAKRMVRDVWMLEEWLAGESTAEIARRASVNRSGVVHPAITRELERRRIHVPGRLSRRRVLEAMGATA